jgi:chaperone modulatory protein CbpM
MTATLGFDELARLVGVRPDDLRGWVAEGWIRPARKGSAYRFDEADVARARLVGEMLRDLAVPT